MDSSETDQKGLNAAQASLKSWRGSL